MSSRHTSTTKGKRVWVTLKSGRSFLDRFVERTASKDVVLEQAGRVSARDIKKLSDYKQKERP